MKSNVYIFSCVIISAENIDDLNESITVRNPFGEETFELVFNIIYLALLACSITPIYCVTLNIRTKSDEQDIKITLDRSKVKNMTKDEIKIFLKKEAHKQLL